MGGRIPIGPLKKSFDSNIMLVGDAAAQVKPTSGGGIYPGIYCGDICAKISVDALKNEDFSSNNLRQYHKLWTADIGKELNKGLRFRRIYRKLTDDQFNKYIEKFSKTKKLLVKHFYRKPNQLNMVTLMLNLI